MSDPSESPDKVDSGTIRVDRNRAWFREIFEHAATGIAIADRDGYFVECNPAYCELLGYSAEELRSRTFEALIHDDERQATLEQVERLRAGEISSFEIESRCMRTNGEPVWVHKFCSLLPDDEGVPSHLVALVTDISHRKRQEAHWSFLDKLSMALARKREPESLVKHALREITEYLGADHAVYAEFNADGTALEVLHDYSRREQSLLGVYTLPEYLSRDALEQLHKGEGQVVCDIRADSRTAMHAGAFGGIDVAAYMNQPLVTSEGPKAVISLTSSRTRDWRPDEVALLADVAARLYPEVERAEAEAALRENAAQLEQRVEQRTREAEDAKLAAERADASKSRFLAAASHDLRQPLHTMSIYLSVLDDMLDSRKTRNVSAKIRSSIDLMRDLLDALLDISKLEMGAVKPALKDVAVGDLLNVLIDDNAPSASAKGLDLILDAEHCVIHTDPGLLQRIIENFVTNAIRYTETGRVVIRCRPRGKFARIEVEDTGMGIPADALESIFEEYYQLDNSVRDREKGLGLGLSIVKRLAKLLDHPLAVQSVPGEGSIFSIDVPLGTRVRNAAAAHRRAPSRHVGTSRPVVLLVDDDRAVVDATTMLLEAAGIEVHSALNGDEALAVIDGGVRPDILVSDYRLPRYDGLELIDRVRDATVKELPAVLLTGDTSAGTLAASNIPNCAILQKPVDVYELVSLIEQSPGTSGELPR